MSNYELGKDIQRLSEQLDRIESRFNSLGATFARADLTDMVLVKQEEDGFWFYSTHSYQPPFVTEIHINRTLDQVKILDAPEYKGKEIENLSGEPVQTFNGALAIETTGLELIGGDILYPGQILQIKEPSTTPEYKVRIIRVRYITATWAQGSYHAGEYFVRHGQTRVFPRIVIKLTWIENQVRLPGSTKSFDSHTVGVYQILGNGDVEFETHSPS